jgi:hypothetical protein
MADNEEIVDTPEVVDEQVDADADAEVPVTEEAASAPEQGDEAAVGGSEEPSAEEGNDQQQLAEEKKDEPGEDIDEEDEEGSYLSDEETSAASDETGSLLRRAQERLQLQRCMDEIETLKEVIERKNGEIENLAGQLRRALVTKVAIADAHDNLEKDLKLRENGIEQMKKASQWMVESHSTAEKDLLNEIMGLTGELREAQDKFHAQLAIKEHTIGEKDFMINRLKAEINRLRQASMSASGSTFECSPVELLLELNSESMPKRKSKESSGLASGTKKFVESFTSMLKKESS